MSLFQIDHHIPVPASGTAPGQSRAGQLLGLERMNLGDSIFVSMPAIASMGYKHKDAFTSAARNAFEVAAKGRGMKVAMRSVTENEIDGVRMWAIAIKNK